uniref:Glutathione peroxidase 6-like n=1 Tax=Erpetoichthys calabaricus TaxID=27687 RepID=A0A8C4SXN3_ERPCA
RIAGHLIVVTSGARQEPAQDRTLVSLMPPFAMDPFREENYETLNVLKYVRPGGGFIPRFQVFGKLEVNGADEHPLFTFLKESCSFVNPFIGDPKRLYWSPMKVSDIRWNFEKFLILPNGVPFNRLLTAADSRAEVTMAADPGMEGYITK